MSKSRLVFGSTKTWKAVVSAAFRQWRATHSHCSQVHGYGLTFEATFEADELDERNWVVDFGGLKSFKVWLEETFDHKTVVAHDDPELDWFRKADGVGALSLIVVDNVGCEAFARMAFERLERWLVENGYAPRVRLVKMEVREHEGNSAYVRLRQYCDEVNP